MKHLNNKKLSIFMKNIFIKTTTTTTKWNKEKDRSAGFKYTFLDSLYTAFPVGKHNRNQVYGIVKTSEYKFLQETPSEKLLMIPKQPLELWLLSNIQTFQRISLNRYPYRETHQPKQCSDWRIANYIVKKSLECDIHQRKKKRKKS